MSARRRVVGDVELPHQDLDLSHLSRPYRPNPLAAAQAWSEDVWQEQHENCEAAWYCESCELPQCPRCHPSPAEFRRCADCSWFDGGAA